MLERREKIIRLVCLSLFLAFSQTLAAESTRFHEYRVNPKETNLAIFWRDEAGKPFQTFQRLKRSLAIQNKTLVFAMNGGIFQEDLKPLGLFVGDGRLQYRINRRQHAYGNFYIQPNGVFYITKDRRAYISQTKHFHMNAAVNYATQSGPLLLINRHINTKLTKGSLSLRVRNGVCTFADGSVLFAMSKYFINFYDFAAYFQQQGCENALYLDGSASRIYLPAKNILMDGRFGPIIAATESVD